MIAAVVWRVGVELRYGISALTGENNIHYTN